MSLRFIAQTKQFILALYHNLSFVIKKLSELSSEYGVSKSTINGWVKNLRPVATHEGEVITMKEYKALKIEIAKIKEENEILKKAMAIFAKK